MDDSLNLISIKPSRIAQHLHIAVGVLAIMGLYAGGLSIVFKILGSFVLLAGIYWQWNRLLHEPIQGLACKQGQWVLLLKRQKSGKGKKDNQPQEIFVELIGEQVILPWLVTLEWKEQELTDNKKTPKKYRLALWPDSLEKNIFRKLKVFLRFG